MNLNNQSWGDEPENIWNSLGNLTHWVFTHLGKVIYDNQGEIIEAVCDPKIKDLDILAARGGGKSIAVCFGLIRWCIENPNLRIGVFAPKEEQATRLLDEILDMAKNEQGLLAETLDIQASTKSRLNFKNGSRIVGLSAAEETMQEGWHFDIIVLDEAHQLSDFSVNSRIAPMLRSKPIGKMIKIGIPMYKNHFWKGAKGGNHTVIIHDWLHCDIFRDTNDDPIIYNGIEYPRRIALKLPLSVKLRLFPNMPELHFEGDMTEHDFNVNYAMEWAEDVNLELSDEDRLKLTDSIHSVFANDAIEELYWGLDTAAGGGQKNGGDRDYTVLAIWRKRPDGVKEKIISFEWRDEDQPTQALEIMELIHPITGRYKCKFGLADLSNWGKFLIDTFKQERIAADGVMFGSTDPATKKNFKNAMHDYFKIELQNNRVKYPSMIIINESGNLKKGYNEWINLERHQTGNPNAKIGAPSGLHDDHVSADILCVYAMGFRDTFAGGLGDGVILPKPIIMPGGFGSCFTNRNQQSPGKYLG